MPCERLVGLARAAAASNRLGMTGQGGVELARLVDELLVHLGRRPELAAALAPLLAQVVAAQERGDPIGLADRLEHELVVLLRAHEEGA
jgi:hypothetical protein